MYVCVHILDTNIYIYIYIYRERERDVCKCTHTYIYIYIYVHKFGLGVFRSRVRKGRTPCDANRAVSHHTVRGVLCVFEHGC